MDNEETKILNPQQNPASKAGESTTPKAESKGATFGARAAATAAGAALGTSAAMAADDIIAASVAKNEEIAEATAEVAPNETTEQPVVEENTDATTTSVQEAPSEQDAIIATDEGLHVAHVDDSLTFSQAFAEARAQVGAGGLFEWHGKVYGTFYKTEWDDMSASERADWQSKVDYDDVLGTDDASAATESHTVVEHVVTVQVQTPQESLVAAVPEDGTYIDEGTTETVADEDNEVHVVGVAVHDNGHGGMATIAGLQTGDDMAVVIDVDSDGSIDIVGFDENQNGQFEADELHAVSDAPFSTGDVVGAYVAEAHAQGEAAVVTDLDDGSRYLISEDEAGFELSPLDETVPEDDMYMASDDGMPDYMNDADAGIMDA